MANETKPQRYHIYGRRRYSQPLEYIEERTAADVDELREQPAADDEWVELVAIPETAIVRVIPRSEIS